MNTQGEVQPRPRRYSALVLFFSIVHLPLLLGRSVAWDGLPVYWLMKTGRLHVQMSTWWEVSGFELMFLQPFIAWFRNPEVAFKVLVFFSFLIVAAVFLYFADRHALGDSETRLFCALFFSLQATYLVGPELGVPYPIPYALFAIGAYVHDRVSLHMGSSALRLFGLMASLLCFLVSYSFEACLVFYFVFLWSAYLLNRRGLRQWLRRDWPYLPLPFLFWLILPKPSGAYGAAGYNQIRVVPLLWAKSATIALFRGTLAAFLRPLLVLMKAPWLLTVYVATAILAFTCWEVGSNSEESPDSTRSPRALFGAALIVWAAGAFPFVAVNKAPLLQDWASRWGLLVWPGASLAAAAFVLVLQRHLGQRKAQAIGIGLLALLATGVVDNYRRWDIDWYKQVAVIDQLRAIETVRDASTIMVDDRTQDLNNLGRWYRFYEFNGWFALAYGDETRFGCYDSDNGCRREYADVVAENKISGFTAEKFLLKNYDPMGACVRMEIDHGSVDPLTPTAYMRIKLAELTNPSRFHSAVADIVVVRTRSRKCSALSSIE